LHILGVVLASHGMFLISSVIVVIVEAFTMSEIMGVAGWLAVVVGLLVAAALTGQYDSVKAKLFLKKLRDYATRDILENRKAPKARGRPVKDIRSLFSKLPDIKLDYVIYQMGIRPRIPLMDCIYHLYLKSLLKEGKIAKVVIIATQDLSSPEQKDLELFSRNTKSIYGEYAKYINISFLSADDATLASKLLTEDFNNAVKHIEDAEFVQSWKRRLDLKDKVTKKAIVNLLHPIPGNIGKILNDGNPLNWTTTIRNQSGLYNIVHHINRTWIICCSLERIIPELISDTKSNLAIGSIFWEIEIAKLGMIDAYIKQKTGFLHYPILGSTVAHSDGKTAIPTHKHNEAICIHDDIASLIEKMGRKSKIDRESHVSLLGLIAQEFSVEKTDENMTKAGRDKLENMSHNGNLNLAENEVDNFPDETYRAVALINRITMKCAPR
jgi:hypothetical protein